MAEGFCGGFRTAFENGRLFVTDTIEKLKVLGDIVGEDTPWVGLDDIDQEDEFVWSDGCIMTPEERSTLFAPGEPNAHHGEDENCGQLKDGFLNDEPCSWGYSYVCEMAIVSNPIKRDVFNDDP